MRYWTNIIALLLLVVSTTHALSWRQRKQKKRAREGWRKTKKGWERLDLPPNSKMRIGITHRPTFCSAKSQKGDFLSLHYNGTLWANNKVFDSSILREEPFVFKLGEKQMHEGFERGLQHMCVGERRKIVVPSDLAYGEVGGYGSESANKIKPNATLVYKVELLDILTEEEQLHTWPGGCRR